MQNPSRASRTLTYGFLQFTIYIQPTKSAGDSTLHTAQARRQAPRRPPARQAASRRGGRRPQQEQRNERDRHVMWGVAAKDT